MTDMVYGTVLSRPGEPILSRWWRTIDRTTLGAIVVLFGVGLYLALAASQPLAEQRGGDPMAAFQKQAVFAAVSFISMIVLSVLGPVQVRRFGIVTFLVVLACLLLLPLIGHTKNGATRWLVLAGFSIQPSEFVKPTLIILSAWLVGASQEINGPPGVSLSLGMTILVVALLLIQPDVGQGALIALGWMVIYFISGGPMVLIGGLAGIVAGVGIMTYFQFSHIRDRINTFFSDEVNPYSQIGRAVRAVQEGGLFGQGMGEGWVKYKLADSHTDFIIAVAAEEHGLVFVLAIMALYVTVVVRSLWRLTRERDPFIRLAGAALALTFAAQAFVNIGVAVQMLPTTGMTLPLISYGGSSMLATGIALGMLLAFTRSRPQGQIEDAFQARRR